MSIETFELNVPYEKAGLDKTGLNPTLTAVIEDFSKEICTKARPAVVICPGGGYDYTSDREAMPVAMRFCSYGVNAFILRYSCVKKPFPTALLELAAAVAFVRSNAEKFNINKEKIAVCGFSAGGHLAACLSTLWDRDFVKNPFGFDNEHKPDASILCYPVITSGIHTHGGSIINIIGENPPKELSDLVSCEKQVNALTPKAFLWHTSDDGVVPPENTILYISALSRFNIPFECHIYPNGCHGLSLCDDTTAAYEGHYHPAASRWIADAIRWLKEL